MSLTDKFRALESLMKALEHNTGQEIQDLQKAMVSRFNKIEEIIDSDEQEQKVERQHLPLKTLESTQSCTCLSSNNIRKDNWLQNP